eukprot:GHRR01023787.1.p1 GENE.GHRR01023787.1~~GHRR01023787.1.p1  ORF type:complete len:308 (+),score=95.99 GHRR01023787.1:515-1438(+)
MVLCTGGLHQACGIQQRSILTSHHAQAVLVQCQLCKHCSASSCGGMACTYCLQAMAFWRDEQQVDQLLSRYQFRELPEVRKHYPHFYHKTDRWGRPLYIELLGKTDVDALMKVTTMERFVQYHIQQCESFRKVKLPACSAAAGRTILTTTIILDLAGLSPTRHFTLTVKRFLETVSLIDQDYFPEHLGCMFIINTPLLFRSFWSVVKGFLDERTLAKIKVLGSSYKPELLEVIPVENLPNFLGGTSVCTELIDVGPWQDATIVAGSPALLKAGAAGQLGVNAGLPQSDSFEELNHRSGMIGTSVEAA